MATSREVAERLLKLLINKEIEDEYLDDISTHHLCEGLTELVERARIGVEVVTAWEREKTGEQAPAEELPAEYASKPKTLTKQDAWLSNLARQQRDRLSAPMEVDGWHE